MAEQVVKDLRVTARDEGVERVVNRLTALQGASRAAATAIGEVGVASEQSARRTADSSRALDRYAERTTVNSRAVREFARDLKVLDTGLAAGALSAQGHARELQRIQRSLQDFRITSFTDQSAVNDLLRVRTGVDAVTNSARESARAFEESAAKQRAWASALNQGFGFDRISRDAIEAAASFNELFRNQEKVGRAFRDLVTQRLNVFDGVRQSAEQASSAFEELFRNQERIARQVRSGIDSRLGIGQAPGRAAASSADAFAPIFRQEDAAVSAYAKRLAEVKAAIDPVAAAQDRFNVEVAEYNALRAAGDLTDQQFAQGLVVANTRLQQTEKSLVGFGDSARLGVHEVQNLSYQLNDIGVSLMSGQSPFVVLLQQGAQIAQLFGPDVGVLAAIKQVGAGIVTFLSNPITLAVAGFAALAGGITLAWNAFKGDAKPIGDALEAHKRNVSSLTSGYDLWTESIEKAARASRGLLTFTERQSRAELEIAARRALREGVGSAPGVVQDFLNSRTRRPLGGIFSRQTGSDEFLPEELTAFEAPLRRLREQLAAGKGDADAFVRAVAEIANQNPLNDELQETAAILLDVGSAAAEAQRYLDSFSASQARAAERARTFNDLAGEIGSFIPNRTSDRDQIEQTYQQMMRLAATEADVTRAQDLRRLSLGELDRVENQRRASYEIDLQAITARTAEERALAEAQRVRNDLAGGTLSATEIETQAMEAYTLAIAGSTEEWRRAAEARQFAREDALSSARAEVDTFGMTAGAAQAYTQSLQQLTELRRAAVEGGFAVDPAEEQVIRDAARAMGEYTDALRRMNMERDQSASLQLLQGESRLVGLSENARKVAMAGLQAEAALRRDNISTTDAWGQSYIRNAEHAARFRIEIDRQTEAYQKQRDALSNVASTFLDIFTDTSSDGFFDRIMKGLADIGRQFAELGKQKLMERLFGEGINYTAGAPAPGQRSVAQPGFSAGVTSALPAAMVMPTQRPEFVGQAAAAVSGQVMTYAGRFNKAVDGRLMTILETAASRFPMQVEAISGLRPGDKRFHGRGLAADIQITGSNGQRYGNYQNAADFRVYEQFAQEARRAQQELFPELGKLFRWGGYFSGGKGKYGALDSMHFDLGGAGMGGGTWEGGLTASQRRLWAGAQSVGMGGSTAAIERAVKSGTTNAFREVAGGSASYAGSNVPIPTARPNVGGQSSTGWFGEDGRLQQTLKSPFGQGAMNALGAFGAGQQGGYASGALTGGLGAIGMGLGPLGIAAGVAGGLLGGLFGGRQKRKQEHQARAQEWAQMEPQWNAYQEMTRTGVGPTSGIRADQTAKINEFGQFVQAGSAAWKNGSNNSSALFEQVTSQLGGYFQRTNQAFAGGFDANVRSLGDGQGMQSPFLQARDGIIEMGKGLLTFIDDARVVFGDGSDQVRQATEASVAQLRAMVSGGAELTEVGAQLETLAGAGNALGNQLMQLGVSFEDASREVGEAAHLMITRIRGDFVQGIQDQIDTLDGKAYVADFRELISGVDLMLKDAAALGVDRSLVDSLFAKQAQSMVNGAELTGSAFADLIVQFPRLAGVVQEYSAAMEEVIKRTADQLSTLRLSYDDRVFETSVDTSTEAGSLLRFDRYAAREREEEMKAGGEAILDLERALAAERNQIVKQFADRAIEEQKRALESAQSFIDGFARDIGGYLDGLRGGADSQLTGQARIDEAQKQFDAQLALARGGDKDALGSITTYADRLLEADRAYNTSSPAFQATFDRVTGALEGLPKQLKAEDIVAAEIAKAAKETQDVIRQSILDLAGRISSDFAKFDGNFDGFLTIDELRPHFAGTELELRRIFTEIDLNGDGMVSRMEGLLASDGLTRSTLQSAFTAGPNVTASALAPHFSRLDTSLNGLLSFDEMRVALGGIATDDQIRQMMMTLDANGDGQLSYLELINANGGLQIGQGQAQATTMAAIERLTVQQLATANWHTQWFDLLAKHITHGTNINQSMQHVGHQILDRIRANLAEENGSRGIRQFMTGGYTGDMATSAVAGQVHGREFVAHAEATRQFRPFLEQMNAGTFRPPVIPMPIMPQMANDNRAIEHRLERIERAIERSGDKTAQAALRAGENTREGVDELAEVSKGAGRESRRAKAQGGGR